MRMKVLADMHVAPAVRRWVVRLVLAIIVAIAIGYVPGGLVGRDPRALKLHAQLDALDAEARALAAANAALASDIAALKSDVRAIEDRARDDLGMVYPDEVVVRVVREADAEGAP
jgi:cell division protein FtsB